MASQSSLVRIPTHRPELVELPKARAEHYGGMVGELLKQIETRMAYAPQQQLNSPILRPATDVAHMVSVASGYIGLALGFVGTGYLIGLAF